MRQLGKEASVLLFLGKAEFNMVTQQGTHKNTRLRKVLILFSVFHNMFFQNLCSQSVKELNSGLTEAFVKDE